MGARRWVMLPGWGLLVLVAAGVQLWPRAAALLAEGWAEPSATARDGRTRLSPGVILEAVDGVTGPPFEGARVLLVQHGPDRSWGLVVNDPGHRWGGPVRPTFRFTLLRSDRPPRDALHVVDDLYVLEGPSGWPAGARIARELEGYTGWVPGQLEDEVAAGAWRLRPGSADAVLPLEEVGEGP